MDDRVKTSFIPKASLKVERQEPRARAGSFDLLNTITGALMVIVLVGAAGIFLYQGFLGQSINAKQESLVRSREAFEPATIRELSRLNTRILTGQQFLGTHIAPSNIFDELETKTLASVRYRNINYDATAPDKISLTMDGAADSFNAVALQSVEFSKSDIIKDPIFSNVNIDQTGAVSFNFNAIIDVAELRYRVLGVSSPASSEPALPPLAEEETTPQP